MGLGERCRVTGAPYAPPLHINNVDKMVNGIQETWAIEKTTKLSHVRHLTFGRWGKPLRSVFPVLAKHLSLRTNKRGRRKCGGPETSELLKANFLILTSLSLAEIIDSDQAIFTRDSKILPRLSSEFLWTIWKVPLAPD